MSKLQPPSETVLRFLAREHRMLIGADWLPAVSGRTFEVIDPATGDVIARVPEGDAADVDAAVRAARTSFDTGAWHGMTADARSRVLWRFGELIEQNYDELAQLETINNGMPGPFAQFTIQGAASWLRYYAGMIGTICGENTSGVLSGGGQDVHAYTARQPIGVAALIIPWNGPIGTFVIKVAPALAAGCSCVVKPAENTPLTALRLGELALEAGLPPGVLNIVTGFGATAGGALVRHPMVDKVSFTGSTAVGKQIAAEASQSLKRVTLELGGKSPCIVFDDADLEQAIPGASMGIFANTGQVCFAGSRLYVQRKSFDKVVAGIAEHAAQIPIGNGLDPTRLLGPLISEKQMQRVSEFIDGARAEGAELVCGGGRHGDRGYFMQPTIFANVNRDMRIVREEVFGPVLVATPFDELDEVIAAANDTRYGLGSGVFTTDVNKAHLVARRIDAGNVWVNCYGIMHPAMPFGGFKESGWGREFGPDGLDAYLEKKSVFVQLKQPGAAG